mmetsp:Transcript_108059/g.312241  ORF Transcript_108059/g.312241 Transcript_108059/m.312241 type:complete len:341 (-) Transcript_108059:39-1061(-)
MTSADATATQSGQSQRDGQQRPSVARSASNIIGLPVAQQAPPPSRVDLVQRGMTAQQADATIVRQEEAQVIASHYMRYLACFGCFVTLVALTVTGLLIWLAVAFGQAGEEGQGRERDCDVPLWTWTLVVFCAWVVRNLLKSLIDRCICCWTPQYENERAPLRVQLKDVLILVFEFVWVIILGFYWIATDGDESNSTPACKDVTPNLYKAAKVYVCFNAAATLFFWVSTIGLLTVLRILMRRGMLSTTSGAPPETIDNSTEVVKLTKDELAETPACPVCIADFDDGGGKPIAKVKACGHVFHKQCLQGWLKVAKTCPLCRIDLTQGAATGSPNADVVGSPC